MTDKSRSIDAGQRYATAYAAHYTTKDLRGAIGLYKGVIATHPDSPEAGYSHTQIQNIANHVVPKQELLDVPMNMALSQLEGDVCPAVADAVPKKETQ